MSDSDNYKAGTKRGTGITFNRIDDELISEQKKAIGLIIKSKMKEKGVTYRRLEELTNIYNPQISAMANAKTNYTIDNFLRVLNSLGLEFIIKESHEEYDTKKIDLIIDMLEKLKSK